MGEMKLVRAAIATETFELSNGGTAHGTRLMMPDRKPSNSSQTC